MAQDRVKYNERVESLKAQMIITVEDISASSLVDLNVDPVKIIPYVVEAQKLQLEPLIGTALTIALKDTNRTYKYDYLINNYVADTLIHWALVEYVASNKFTISNGGFYRHLPEDAETASVSDVNVFIQQERYKSQDFADRMINFLDLYENDYPEYTDCIKDGLRAKRIVRFSGGWVFGDSLDCGTCSYDENLFDINFWEGANNISAMGFDLSTLNESNTIPNDVWAQPNSQYYWIVSTMEVYIIQAAPIPLDDFSNTTPEEAVYVLGQQDDKFWIRIKISDTYEEPVNFQIKIK